MKNYKLLAVFLSVFFVGIIVLQFVLTKDIRHDNQVASDLMSIENAFQQAPMDEDLLKGEIDIADLDIDSDIKARAEENNYSVKVISRNEETEELTLEICGSFKRDTSDYSSNSGYDYSRHSQGESCFERTIYLPPLNR